MKINVPKNIKLAYLFQCTIFLLLFAFTSCKPNKTNNHKQQTTQEITFDSSITKAKKAPNYLEKNESVRKEYKEANSISKVIKNSIDRLKSEYDYFPFAFMDGSDLYLYTITGNYNAQKPFEDVEYAIVDSNGLRLTFDEYNKIYTPNLCLPDCIEIEKDGKIGLFNYKSLTTIDPKYEFIAPKLGNINSCIGKMGNDFYEINYNSKFTEAKIEYSLNQVYKNIAFEFNPSLGGIYLTDIYGNFQGEYPQSNIIISPSYLYKLTEIDELFTYQDTETFAFVKTLETRQYDGIFGAVVEIYTKLFDVRDYSISNVKAISFKTENRIPKIVEIDENPFANSANRNWFVSDSIIEVLKYNFQLQENPEYEYYLATENGFIKLNTDRKYNFTKYARINPEYLDVRISIPLTDSLTEAACNEYLKKTNDDDIDAYKSILKARRQHYNIHELNIMRNEIFAEYGYIFKTEKWKNYFEKKSWYKPRFENVNDELTDIDKHNIQVILKTIEDIKSGKIKISKSAYPYVAAG